MKVSSVRLKLPISLGNRDLTFSHNEHNITREGDIFTIADDVGNYSHFHISLVICWIEEKNEKIVKEEIKVPRPEQKKSTGAAKK